MTVSNRQGLSALSYRIGSFASFRRSMLDGIASDPRLSALSTRDSDDYAIVLLELFAAVADVLCFYNERISNEFFIRTAVERDSVLRMVALLGYRPRPGLAATALVAFALDEHATTRIRRGLRIMSMPGQDERAQTYETVESVTAFAGLNALPVYGPPLPFNPFARGSASAIALSRPDPLSIGDRVVAFGLGTIEEKTVTALDRRADGERLGFDPPIQADGLRPEVARLARADKRLRFFGYNAPASHNIYDTNPATPPHKRWKTTPIDASFGPAQTQYPLDARHDDVKPGDQFLIDCGAGVPRLRTAVVHAAEDRLATAVGPLSDSVTHTTLRQTISGRPVPVAAPAGLPIGSLRVATRSGAGVLQLLLRGGGSQIDTVVKAAGQEAHACDEPAAVNGGPHDVDLFYRDDAGRLMQAFRSGAGWSVSVLGGATLARPAAVWHPGGQAVVACTSVNGKVRVLRIGAGGIVEDQTLTMAATSAPTIATFDGSRVDVVARGTDRGIWHAVKGPAGWSGFMSLGGVAAATPVLALPTPGRPELFITGPDGRLRHRHFDGTAWSDWLDLGGDVEGEPALAVTGAGLLMVFARGRDSDVWTTQRTGTNWTAWSSLRGPVTSVPTCAIQNGVLRIFVRDGDGGVSFRAFTGGEWSAWAPIGFGLDAIPDRRHTRMYRLSRPDIALRPHGYPTQLTGGRLAIALVGATGLEGIAKGRRLILDNGARQLGVRVTASTEFSTSPGGDPDHLLVDFVPPVDGLAGEVRMLGNVAETSHGESQPLSANPDGTPGFEPLGNGDATKAFQSFPLSRGPLTYLPSRQDAGGKAEIEIRVNDELWQQVPSLYGARSTDRVYTLRQNDAGQTRVGFGDGRTGARLKTGAMNVTARYRTGLGLQGRVRAGQLAIPLERPVGLRGVHNPLPSDGGADAEARDDARRAAPASVKTFGRAVSLQDFEGLAMASGLIARAFATWVWLDLQRTVHLTVAAVGGTTLSTEALDDLHASLNTIRDTNRPLVLSALVRVPLVIRARLLRDPAYEADNIAARARAHLLAAFAFEAQEVGAAVHASSIFARLQEVTGVRAVDVDLFQLKGYLDLSATERGVRSITIAPVQPHIRIYPARPSPADPAQIDRFARAGFDGSAIPPVLAAEQAAILDPADVSLTVVEAL
ncbi:hypothetical protein [Kaistia granuli]|uniref:hypothetical protein n=1 Tax=Kaistia granuli TaxID=363259 RepID=UPI00037D1CEF|nr:hypothetical protein [Kaistia granuli]